MIWKEIVYMNDLPSGISFMVCNDDSVEYIYRKEDKWYYVYSAKEIQRQKIESFTHYYIPVPYKETPEVNRTLDRQLMESLSQFGIGVSSQSILNKALEKRSYSDYPYDIADLLRCVNVVRIFGIDINIMKEDTNNIWIDIVNNWDALVILCDLYMKNPSEEKKQTVGHILSTIIQKYR